MLTLVLDYQPECEVECVKPFRLSIPYSDQCGFQPLVLLLIVEKNLAIRIMCSAPHYVLSPPLTRETMSGWPHPRPIGMRNVLVIISFIISFLILP